MIRPTPRTSPNCSSDGSHTFAQLHRKVPIGYSGAPHICLLNYPFPWTDPQTQWPALSLGPCDLPCQMVSGSDVGFSQCTGQTQTDRWLKGMVCNSRLLSLYRQQRGQKIASFYSFAVLRFCQTSTSCCLVSLILHQLTIRTHALVWLCIIYTKVVSAQTLFGLRPIDLRLFYLLEAIFQGAILISNIAVLYAYESCITVTICMLAAYVVDCFVSLLMISDRRGHSASKNPLTTN